MVACVERQRTIERFLARIFDLRYVVFAQAAFLLKPHQNQHLAIIRRGWLVDSFLSPTVIFHAYSHGGFSYLTTGCLSMYKICPTEETRKSNYRYAYTDALNAQP